MAESLAAFQVKFLRGTASANDKYVGPVGEITIDLSNWRIRLQDGVTPGGQHISNLSDLEAVEARIDALSVADIAGLGTYATDDELTATVTAAIDALRDELTEQANANKPGDATQDFTARSLTVHGHILPATAELDLGSPAQRFRGIYVDEAYLSTNTLYIGDTPIMGTEQDTILIKADQDQSITMRTQGSGVTTLQSQKGVNINTAGTNADVEMVASGVGSKVRLTAQDDVELIGSAIRLDAEVTAQKSMQVVQDLTVGGNLTVSGNTIQVDAETVRVSDNMLMLNEGEVGSGVTTGVSGIEVNRGNLASYQFVFDETQGLFRVGMVEDLETVATRPWVHANFSTKDHVHANATTTVAGFMSAADKYKLKNIEDAAQRNVDTDLSVGGTGNARTLISSTGNAAALPLASALAAGLMSKEDKVKLDGIEVGAQKNVGDVFSVEGHYPQVRAGGTTKVDVGLGSVRNVSSYSQAESDDRYIVKGVLDLGTLPIV